MFVSFAQNFEDVILNRIFKDKPDGFYIDIGAYHPTIGSVTRHFYDRGWTGINVEPGPMFDELASARPRDINLNLAVLDFSGEAHFVEDPKDLGSSLVVRTPSPGSRPVSCATLEQIVETHARGKTVDFLKIDVEGAEQAIIESTDWRAIRPTILVIEAVRPWTNQLVNQDWEPILLAAGYVRMYFDGINCFYAAGDVAAGLASLFAAPINVLDDSVPHYLLEQIQLANRAKASPPARQAAARPPAPKPEAITRKPRRAGVAGTVLKLIRPIIRPFAARWRKFLAAPALGALRQARADHARLARQVDKLTRHREADRQALRQALARSEAAVERMESLNREAIARAEVASREAVARSEKIGRDLVARTESANQAMANVVADAMLSAAIDASRQIGREPVPAQAAPELTTTLTLPRGGEARIAYAGSDESVGGPIATSGGLWEPHIQRYFERNVRPDCHFLDIGANIGVHSLNVASLAPQGQVTAFEAHPRNFAFLARNLAPRSGFAPMRAVHTALWNEPARLVIAGAEELAGSSFLVPGIGDASIAEDRLRTANPAALRDRQVRMAAYEVDAVTLDGWLGAHPPSRIDLIKMDVEGAEAHVLEGARQSIARYRPTLVVEYNPSCAVNYFGEAPERLYNLLAELFETIHLIDESGGLVPLSGWDDLARRIAAGKGWEDLACA